MKFFPILKTKSNIQSQSLIKLFKVKMESILHKLHKLLQINLLVHTSQSNICNYGLNFKIIVF